MFGDSRPPIGVMMRTMVRIGALAPFGTHGGT